MGDLIERLNAATADWCGQPMADGEPPRDGSITVGDVRGALDELARLRAEVEGMRGTRDTSVDAHWYCVDTCGSAELCMDKDDAELSVTIADRSDPRNAPHYALQLVDAALLTRMAAEVDRLDAGWKESIEVSNRYAEQAGIAERERDELRRRIAEAPITTIAYDNEGCTVLYPPLEWRGKQRVALVRLDAEEAK